MDKNVRENIEIYKTYALNNKNKLTSNISCLKKNLVKSYLYFYY